METVPRASWQHPGSRAASPPCGSRRVGVGEPSSPQPPCIFQRSGGESGTTSHVAPLPVGSISPLPRCPVPSPLEHPALLQPRLPTLDDHAITDVQPGSTTQPGLGWAGG